MGPYPRARGRGRILTQRVSQRLPGQPAITSPNGSLLGLENWERSTRWREAIVEIGRPSLRVHDLRHTYASLARRAGADLRLLQKTMGHASITVTAHIYADLYDDELDDVPRHWTPSTTPAQTFRKTTCRMAAGFGRILAG